MKINIVGGTGVMGKIHKEIFEKSGHEVIISGRNTIINPKEAAKICDLTIVSVPISVTEQIIKEVAPHANAIMDFTSLKEFPVKAMLKYSKEESEVGGLHPLYGDITSTKGKRIIYCKTKRSGKKCEEIIKSFIQSGIEVKEMEPRLHDYIVGGTTQNARIAILDSFASLIEEKEINMRDLYELSPPPTKILLNLISRQVDEKNDELYDSIKRFNPFADEIKDSLIKNLKNNKNNHGKIRKLFGEELLKESQKRAKKLLEDV